MGKELTVERLRKLLHYNQATGIFTWISRPNRRIRIGDVAGTMLRGYVMISVDGVIRAGGRLAWLYVTGQWPQGEIDHKNGIPSENWFDNLRDATTSINRQNQRRPHKRNVTGGFLGVSSAQCKTKPFRARINGMHLGIFQTAEEAYQAYVTAKRTVHPGGMI